MALQDDIDARRREIQTEGYPMSIGELLNLYRDGDLDIHPEFQRFYRWSITQKSRFVESLLLGIPIPSIFVYQRGDGVWDVIDGLQRLSTVFEFMGELRDEENETLAPSVLKATAYLPSLQGKRWLDPNDPDAAFTDTQQRLIKRAPLDLKIVKRESDPETPLELFQRLNTGGSQLSDQELRNSLLIMVRQDFYGWLKRLREFDPFQTSVAASDRAIAEQYDLELAVRFLALDRSDDAALRAVGDITEFLTDTSVQMARDDQLDLDALRERFSKTFSIVATAMEDSAFRRHDAQKDRFLGGFSVSAFEAITTGIAANLIELEKLDEGDLSALIVARIKDLWASDTFREYARGGVRASTRIPKVVPLGRELFKP